MSWKGGGGSLACSIICFTLLLELLDLSRTAQTLSEALTTGKSAADAYLAAGWEVVRISDAHCLCAMAEAFDT